MRLSNNLLYQTSVNKILENQQSVANAQERVNTRQKYLTTSENAAAYSQAALYSDKIQINEQHTKNINQLNGRLETQESILQSINTTIQAAQEKTIQAGNGAYSKDDLASIAGELKELQKSLVSLMNSQSEDGKYIFSGYQDSSQTYTFNNGKYEYQGDQGQHSVTIAKGVDVKSSDNGFSTFEKVDARLNVVSNTGSATGSITADSRVYVEHQGEFDKFHKENYNAAPGASATANTYTVDVTPASVTGEPDEYTILRDGAALTPPVAGKVTDGEAIEFAGMEIKLEGAAPGAFEFELEAPQKENVLNTLQNLITGLNDGSLEGDDFQEVLSDGLVQLKNASEQVVFTQSSLGARMQVVERITDSNSALDINNKANKASLVEIDPAAAISDLTKYEAGLQASQATFGRLANLSLFDYL